MQKQYLGPVAPQERIQTIDIIRGFALLGITIVNFTVDNPGVSPTEGRTGIADQFAYWPIKFFLDDKFMAIYCFLFGLGFSIQMLGAEARGSSFVVMYMRRLIGLALIGAAATILISGRSVLYDYALLGVLLLLLHKLNKKIILVLAILCVLIPWTRSTLNGIRTEQQFNSRTEIAVDSKVLDMYVGVYMANNSRLVLIKKGNKLIGEGPARQFNLTALSDTEFIRKDLNNIFTFMKDSTGMVSKLIILRPDGKKTIVPKIKTDLAQALKEQLQQRASNIRGQESYRQGVVKRARGFGDEFKHWSSMQRFFWNNIGDVLAIFLLGLYAGRRRIFYEISTNQNFLRNVMRWGFLLGICGVTISLGFDAWNYINGINPESYSYLTRALRGSLGLSWKFGVILMALAYVAGLTLLLENINWKKRLSFLAPVGRMGLTNYILQLIVLALFFQGLNNPDKFGPFWRTIFAFIVFALIVIISRLWFKYFKMGPLEWLWRSLTYLKFQPMKLKASDENSKPETMNI